MFKSKYSNFLTIVLAVAIIAIIAIVSILGVNTYKKFKNRREQGMATMELENKTNIEENTTDSNDVKTQDLIEQEIVDNAGNINTETSGTNRVTYFPGTSFVVIGKIEIPSIKLVYSILEEETVPSLEKSVAVRYPTNPQLNTVGNVVIVGHNYRNGMFFSNLKKVSTGDKVRITDTSGQTLVYTIYEKYETTPEDVAYITRDVGNNIEITLVTCTDDSKARIILKARA